MKIVKLSSECTRDEIVSLIKNYELVNANVIFDPKLGKPIFKLKEKGNSLRITCEFLDGRSRDNEFLVGTYFKGRITEKDGVTTLVGVVTTAPIYHSALILMLGAFILQCIRFGGFSPVPIILLAFSFLLFRKEFKKQGIIKRYLDRVFRYTEKNKK